MPKARLIMQLDNPKDYFEILKGGEKFKDSIVSLKVSGKSLYVDVEADNARSMTSAIGNVIKQIRIVEESSDAIGKK